MTTMKAVRIHHYGNRDALQMDHIQIPTPASNEILVRIIATSINPVDWKIREGYLQSMIPYTLPVTLGWDVSGVVEAIGENVTHFKIGDEIFSRPAIERDGTYAEYSVINESDAAHKPKTLSHAQSAALPLAGITAWEAIVKIGKVEANQRVLIHAASGGVGTLAVQIAKERGAYVIATTSSKNSELVASLGADEIIDYRTQKFNEVLEPVDFIFDTLGGEVQDASWEILKKGGILVSIVSPPSEEKAVLLGVRSAFIFIKPDADILKELASLADKGVIQPIIGAEFTLETIKEAHELSESGRSVGKIIINI